MGEILPDETIQGYYNICPHCKETIEVNMQGTPMNHKCKAENLPIQCVSHFYSVGDIVPYKNTRGNIKEAEVTGFKKIDRNGKWWFYGIDTKTNAKVFYPEHLSRALANCG